MQTINFNQYILPAFYTPLTNYLWADSKILNNELKDHILDLEKSSKGVIKSNVGGWHSELDFLKSDAPCIKQLSKRIQDFTQQLTEHVCGKEFTKTIKPSMSAWANVLRQGQYNSPHNHPNSFWSGVYYVTGNSKLDDHPCSGKLELMDPRPGASINYQDDNKLYGRFMLSPIPGQMVVFPSWLMHHVHPYFGKEERISIAFNIDFE